MISGYDRSNNVVFISRLISSAHLQRNWLTRSVPNNRVTMDSLLVSGSGAARGSLVVSEIGDRGMVWEDSRLKYQEVCFQCIKIHHKRHRAYGSILCLTHCGLVTPYGHIDLVQNWLMAPSHYLNQWHQAITWTNGTKPLPEPMLTYHQWVVWQITWEQFPSKHTWYQSVTKHWKLLF